MKRALAILLVILISPLAIAQAQDTCQTYTPQAIESIQNACSDLNNGQACNSEGERFDLAETDSLTADDLLMLRVNDTLLILYNGAEIQNSVADLPPELPTLNATNAVGYNVNLRSGPDANFPIAGTFDFNANHVIDGRNADSTWLRLQDMEDSAWVFAELVDLDGDIASLEVLDSPYQAPMQAFSLSSDSHCESGLLIHNSGDETRQFQINGLDVEIGGGTLIAQADEKTRFSLIDASLKTRINDENFAIESGQSLSMTSDDRGIQAETLPAYRFSTIANAPLSLIPETQLACIVGVSSEDIMSYRLPDNTAEEGAPLSPAAHYRVTGFAQDEQDQRWWQIREEQRLSWVPQNAVESRGLCENVTEIDPNATVSTNAGGSGGGSVIDALGERSIWWANTGEENRTGTCNFPAVAMCEHLVAITPNADGSISWRGQEPQAYTLAKADENFYTYSGRNKLNSANLSMALTLHSANSWTMTMTQVFDNDPECIRTFYYTASPR